jgi:hypothetical protein
VIAGTLAKSAAIAAPKKIAEAARVAKTVRRTKKMKIEITYSPKTILEIIAEWRKGCSIAGPLSMYPHNQHPVECSECTIGCIEAIEAVEKTRLANENGNKLPDASLAPSK